MPEQILIFRTGSLGDLVCTIPALRAIRSRQPGRTLCLLADSPTAAAREVHHWFLRWGIVDRVVVYQANRGLRGYFDLLRLVRRERAARGVFLLTQQKEKPARIRLKKAFFHLCGLRILSETGHTAFPAAVQPKEPDRLLRLVVDPVTSPRTADDYAIPVEQEHRRQVYSKISAIVNPARPFLLFCCGGKAPTQRWPIERYGEVLHRLNAAVSIPVVAVGLPEEVAVPGEWMRQGLVKGQTLSGLSLPEMCELARAALCYFGNDTGPMHVAAAVGCPVSVVLSARNNRGAWDPDVSPSQIFQRWPACHSCFLHECIEQNHRCMRSIGVEEVATGLEIFLRGLAARRN